MPPSTPVSSCSRFSIEPRFVRCLTTAATPPPPSKTPSSPNAATNAAPSTHYASALAARSRFPPASPHFIPLPKPPMDGEVRLPRHRGYLPVPRSPFPEHEGNRKTTPEYIAQTAPPPAARKPAAPGSRAEWRQRMADTRRQSLESGIAQLWRRKETAETKLRDRSARRQACIADDNAFFHRPADVLTQSTIHPDTFDTTLRPDPDFRARYDRSRSNLLNRDAAAREARRAAINELYHHAKSFIVLESHLKEEIDRVFSDKYFQRWGDGKNAWEAWGRPPGIPDILVASLGDSSESTDTKLHSRTDRRILTLGEELTGGKIV